MRYKYFGYYMNRDYVIDDNHNIYCLIDNIVFYTGTAHMSFSKAIHAGKLEPYFEVQEPSALTLVDVVNKFTNK